jgi:hypothetical protein
MPIYVFNTFDDPLATGGTQALARSSGFTAMRAASTAFS